MEKKLTEILNKSESFFSFTEINLWEFLFEFS